MNPEVKTLAKHRMAVARETLKEGNPGIPGGLRDLAGTSHCRRLTCRAVGRRFEEGQWREERREWGPRIVDHLARDLEESLK